MGKELTETEIREVALAASCDPRTVKRVIAGEPVRALVGDRVRRAMLEHHCTGVVRGDVGGGGTKRGE